MTEVQETEETSIGITSERREITNEIALAFQLRRYEQACQQVDTLLQKQGWGKTIALLREILVGEDQYSGLWYWKQDNLLPLKEGKFRDGLLNILGLEHIPGIDVDLLKTFGRFRANSLQELREKANSKATSILRSQIKKRNTYFIDTAQLEGTAFESLIPEIKKQRAQEFLALGDTPSMSMAAATYYGYAHLTDSLTAEDTIELGKITSLPLELSGKRISYQRSIFAHCSENLTDILLACFRLTFARPQTQKKGADVLAEIADFRSLGALHHVLKQKSERGWYADPLNSVKYRVIWALREIGHPSSLPILKTLVRDMTFDHYVMRAIARNSHPDAVEILLDRAYHRPVPYVRNGLVSQYEAAGMLWKPQDDRVIVPLVELLQNKNVREEAVHSLLRLGSSGYRAIKEHFATVVEIVQNSRTQRHIMEDLLKFAPSLVDLDEFIKLLLTVVEEEPQLLSEVVEIRAEIVQDPRLRDPLLTLLKESRNPAGLLHEFNKVGLLDDPAFSEVARKKIPKIAELVRRYGRRGRILGWNMSSICSLSMLYESDEIQFALAETLENGAEPQSLLYRIEDHEVLGTSHIIHDGVIGQLTHDSWNIWFLETVVKSQNLMQNEDIRLHVAKALASFWSNRRNAQIAVQTDWDCYEYLWGYYLTPLRDYPDMGKITEFQKAIAHLLRHSSYPKGVIDDMQDFDGLLESEPVKKQIQLYEEEKRREEERWRNIRPLSDEEIEEERRRAQNEAYWDQYRPYY